MQNETAVRMLAALALDTRVRVFQLLSTSGSEGLPAGEIARRLGVGQNTLSDHLQILARAGFVIGERNSRMIIYRANPGAVVDLIDFLQAAMDGEAENATS